MSGYRYKIKDNRLYLYCICDSTLFFLNCMKTLLENSGFTDIKCSGHRLENGDKKIPEDKPFCDFEFECSGIFPNNEMRNKFTNMEGVFIKKDYQMEYEEEKNERLQDEWLSISESSADLWEIVLVTDDFEGKVVRRINLKSNGVESL